MIVKNQIIDLLDKAVTENVESDIAILTKEGRISQNKLNLMTGTYASELLDSIWNLI